MTGECRLCGHIGLIETHHVLWVLIVGFQTSMAQPLPSARIAIGTFIQARERTQDENCNELFSMRLCKCKAGRWTNG